MYRIGDDWYLDGELIGNWGPEREYDRGMSKIRSRMREFNAGHPEYFDCLLSEAVGLDLGSERLSFEFRQISEDRILLCLPSKALVTIPPLYRASNADEAKSFMMSRMDYTDVLLRFRWDSSGCKCSPVWFGVCLGPKVRMLSGRATEPKYHMLLPDKEFRYLENK